MNILKKTTKPSAIFLAIVLVAGTIAAISPSFVIEAEAQAEREYRYNSYEPEPEYSPQYSENVCNSYEPSYEINAYEIPQSSYGNENNYHEPREYQSYQKDYKAEYPSYDGKDSYKSKKDSSIISINKLNCINNNVNINGNNTGDVNIGKKGKGYLGTDSYSGYYDGYGNNKQGKNFDCIINNSNNNTNINEQQNPLVAEDANLVVSKFVSCEPSPGSIQTEAACEEIEGERGGFQYFIDPNEFTITVSGDNPNPSQFEGIGFPDLPVVVTLGAGNYQVSETADPSVAATIADLEQIYSVDITQSVIFSGDCDAITGEGTIAEGEVHLCQIENAFAATVAPPGDLTTSNLNIDISAFDINTAGGLETSNINTGDLASSFSSPPTTAQGTEASSSALEKTTKLKQQWLDLLP